MNDIDYELSSGFAAFTSPRIEIRFCAPKKMELQVKCQCSRPVDMSRDDLWNLKNNFSKYNYGGAFIYDVANNQAEFDYHLFMIGGYFLNAIL